MGPVIQSLASPPLGGAPSAPWAAARLCAAGPQAAARLDAMGSRTFMPCVPQSAAAPAAMTTATPAAMTTQATAVSALAFAMGVALPLLSGGFVRPWAAWVAAVCASSSLGLAGFGAAGAYLGGASVVRSGARVLLGRWLAVAVTFEVLRLCSLAFKTHITSV